MVISSTPVGDAFRGDYIPENLKRAKEKYFLTILKTLLSNHMGHRSFRKPAQKIERLSGERTLEEELNQIQKNDFEAHV